MKSGSLFGNDIRLEDIKRAYAKIKRKARLALEAGETERSLEYIETCAHVAYHSNWIYTDGELEGMLKEISDRIIPKREFVPEGRRYVVIDTNGRDNHGLTQQYLRAFMGLGAEILYIYKDSDHSHITRIVGELEKYSKAKVCLFDRMSFAEQAQRIVEEVTLFRADKVFLHIMPWDVSTLVAAYALQGVRRYNINLTDHAYWLGAGCIDRNIEFRDYGYTVSLQKRGLKAGQLLMLPYYPITDCQPFTGFPERVTSDKIVIFTGGAYYKMYGDNGAFFRILSALANLDPRVVILLAGNGDDKPLKNFVKRNGLEEKILFIGNRKDINYVFHHCDIYLSTYPITGGLMGQFAAVNAKPILAYTSPEIPCNFGEGFLNWGDCSSWQVTHTDMADFLREARKLIADPAYRKKRGEMARSHVITPEEFMVRLQKLITIDRDDWSHVLERIDYDRFIRQYLDVENNYLGNIRALILSRLGCEAFRLFPGFALKCMLSGQIWRRIMKRIAAS